MKKEECKICENLLDEREEILKQAFELFCNLDDDVDDKLVAAAVFFASKYEFDIDNLRINMYDAVENELIREAIEGTI